MSLSAGALSSLIKGNLASAGAIGSNLGIFSTAVGTGINMSIVGKSFVTVDAGLAPGVGVGSGTGITGLVASFMASTAISEMPTTGANAMPMMSSIMNAVVTHLGSATLSTTDTPVFAGAGTVTPGTIAVVESEMASNIDSQLASAGANGSNRTVLAKAIAAGVARAIKASGTGSVTIAGSPTSPSPSPGAGAGSGTIS